MSRILAGAVAAALISTGAQAGIRVADAHSAMITLAGANAAQVELKAQSDGKPFIAARLPSGLKFAAYFYACNPNNTECSGMSLVSGFLETRMTITDMNAWNRERLPQAYIDRDNDPVLQLFTHAAGPYGATSLQGLLAYWQGEVGRFRNYVYGEGSTTGVSFDEAAGAEHNAMPEEDAAFPAAELDPSLKNGR